MSETFVKITNKDIYDEIKSIKSMVYSNMETLKTRQDQHEASDKFHHKLQYILGSIFVVLLLTVYGVTKYFKIA